MRKEKFINGEIYHVLNRGVDKRHIFLDQEDYFRFIHNIYEFNSDNPALNIYYRKLYDSRNHKREGNTIVDVLAFVLMPNHYHFLLRQNRDNGIQMFMKKIGCGYANYFNRKNERSGALFQGRFKAILVSNSQHLLHLPFYIHFNPLDICMAEWRQREIRDYNSAVEFLENYRWSSLLDYIGKKNFPSIINKNFLTELIGSPANFRKASFNLLKDFDTKLVEDIILE